MEIILRSQNRMLVKRVQQVLDKIEELRNNMTLPPGYPDWQMPLYSQRDYEELVDDYIAELGGIVSIIRVLIQQHEGTVLESVRCPDRNGKMLPVTPFERLKPLTGFQISYCEETIEEWGNFLMMYRS